MYSIHDFKIKFIKTIAIPKCHYIWGVHSFIKIWQTKFTNKKKKAKKNYEYVYLSVQQKESKSECVADFFLII